MFTRIIVTSFSRDVQWSYKTGLDWITQVRLWKEHLAYLGGFYSCPLARFIIYIHESGPECWNIIKMSSIRLDAWCWKSINNVYPIAPEWECIVNYKRLAADRVVGKAVQVLACINACQAWSPGQSAEREDVWYISWVVFSSVVLVALPTAVKCRNLSPFISVLRALYKFK